MLSAFGCVSRAFTETQSKVNDPALPTTIAPQIAVLGSSQALSIYSDSIELAAKDGLNIGDATTKAPTKSGQTASFCANFITIPSSGLSALLTSLNAAQTRAATVKLDSFRRLGKPVASTIC